MSQATQGTCYMADSCSCSGDQTVGYLTPCYCFWIIKLPCPKISHLHFAGAQETSSSLHFLKREFGGYTINHITCLTEGKNKPQFHGLQYLTSRFWSIFVVAVAATDVLCGEISVLWINSHTFELFSTPQDRSLILLALVVELCVFVWV